tara:strand:+ start:24 stop:782 length:759 start_codon:yes stop_codon:yes gene_type:complete
MAIDTLGAFALASNSVTTATVADNAITNAKIGASAVGTTEVANDAVTSAKLDTNISIGGTLGVTGAITASAGVAVGGTGAVNTLDDYEEGTFDIKLRNHALGVDTNAKTCRYVKIGKLVMIMWPDGGTADTSAYWTDNTASGSAAAAGTRFDVSTSTGFNALPFLPRGTGDSVSAFTRGFRSGDGDSPISMSFAIGWKGGTAQLHIGRKTTDGAEYGIYDGCVSNDNNVIIEKDNSVSNVVFNVSFVYYTDA